MIPQTRPPVGKDQQPVHSDDIFGVRSFRRIAQIVLRAKDQNAHLRVRATQYRRAARTRLSVDLPIQDADKEQIEILVLVAVELPREERVSRELAPLIKARILHFILEAIARKMRPPITVQDVPQFMAENPFQHHPIVFVYVLSIEWNDTAGNDVAVRIERRHGGSARNSGTRDRARRRRARPQARPPSPAPERP
jgi:hypothetical protein